MNAMRDAFDMIGYDFFKASCGKVDAFVDARANRIIGSEM